jgi:hypothetical protein
MKRRTTEKGLHCHGFKRKVQAEIYEGIRGSSPEEEIGYFRRRAAAGPLGKWWKALVRWSETAVRAEASSAESKDWK